MLNVSELKDAALDWAVASANAVGKDWTICAASYRPSTNWSQGGPIIEREKIDLTCFTDGWQAEREFLTDDDDDYEYGRATGPTPLIAAMRCYVASKLGDTIDIPEEIRNA